MKDINSTNKPSILSVIAVVILVAWVLFSYESKASVPAMQTQERKILDNLIITIRPYFKAIGKERAKIEYKLMIDTLINDTVCRKKDFAKKSIGVLSRALPISIFQRSDYQNLSNTRLDMKCGKN
jgi:hypothetical protein